MSRFFFRLAMAWHCLRAPRVIVLLPFHKGSDSVCDARIYNGPGPIVWETIIEWAARRHAEALQDATARLLAEVEAMEDEQAQELLIDEARGIVDKRRPC